MAVVFLQRRCPLRRPLSLDGHHPRLAAAVAHDVWMKSLTSLLHGRAAIGLELLSTEAHSWEGFLLHPSQEMDTRRYDKRRLKYLEFRPKSVFEGLWVDSWWNCQWGTAKMATMISDHMQSNGRLKLKLSTSYCVSDKVRKLCYEGRLREAIKLITEIVEPAKAPVSAYVCLLKECARRKALEEGRNVHALIVQNNFESNIVLSNRLVAMYSKCGSVLDAQKVFSNMQHRNVFSWTAIISAYAESGKCEEALNLFQQMLETGIEADKVALVVVLKACVRMAALEQGKQLHFLIARRGFESDVIVQSVLVDMYAKCGCLDDARKLFDNMKERDVVSWNAMVQVYAENSLSRDALALYEKMKQEGVQPNKVTFVIVLKACASIAAIEQGKQVHSLIRRRGLESDVVVQSSLVDMYAKCGFLDDARKLFDNMMERDVILWNAMIHGYAQNGLGMEALALYDHMQHSGVQPNKVTFVGVIKACASITAIEQGKQLHSLIQKRGLESELIVQSALVNLYAKCGCLEDARKLFNSMRVRDLVSWNAMIQGYVKNGCGKESLDLYEQMKLEGVQPDKVTHISVLSACSHSGLVNEGCRVFDSMVKQYGVTPILEHYACMVDLLGRAGCLANAEDFIMKMPIEPDEVIWMSLLSAAKNWGRVEIGKRAFDRVVKLEPENAAPYLLLLDMYAAAGMMDEVAKIRKEMEDKGLQKLRRPLAQMEGSW